MEKQLDLGFCILIYSTQDKDIHFEKEILTNAYNSNQKFAKIKIPKFNIQLVYSREEFNKLWGDKTQDFVSAFVKDDKIVIFSYGVFDQETTWKKKEFYNTLIHEINHLFYQELRDDEYDPLWLSEGLATFMQHHQRKSTHKIKSEITEKVLEQKFEEITIESYSIFGAFVEYLILNFGRDKLLELISGLREGDKLNYLFPEIYNKSFIELINNANQYKKTT